MTNEEIGNAIWSVFKDNQGSIHELSGKAVEETLRLAMVKKSLDNVTGVLICFKSIDNFLHKQLDNGPVTDYCSNKDVLTKTLQPSVKSIDKKISEKSLEMPYVTKIKGNMDILRIKLGNINTSKIPLITKVKITNSK